MAGATRLANHLMTSLRRLGANPVGAGARAVRGASAGRALSTAAPEIFGLCAPPLVDPETLRSRWREEVLSLFDTPSANPIATGGAPSEAPLPRSHELGGYS